MLVHRNPCDELGHHRSQRNADFCALAATRHSKSEFVSFKAPKNEIKREPNVSDSSQGMRLKPDQHSVRHDQAMIQLSATLLLELWMATRVRDICVVWQDQGTPYDDKPSLTRADVCRHDFNFDGFAKVSVKSFLAHSSIPPDLLCKGSPGFSNPRMSDPCCSVTHPASHAGSSAPPIYLSNLRTSSMTSDKTT